MNSKKPRASAGAALPAPTAMQRLYGANLKDYFSRTTVWKYTTDILKKTGIDMRASRRPEKLPLADLRELQVRNSIVPKSP